MFLNLLIEVILLAILVGGSCFGYRKGIFRMTAGPIRNLICLFGAFSLCDTVGGAIIAPFIRIPISSFLLDFLRQRLADTDFTHIPTVLRMMGAVFGVSYANVVTETTLEDVVTSFTDPFVTLISRTVAFILMFILLKYLLKLLVYLADSFLSVGIIGTLNRVLGAFASICIAVVGAIAFTSAVDYLFRTNIFADSRLVMDFDGGPLYRLFREINPLSLLLSF